MTRILRTSLLILAGAISLAGTPFEQTKACPVGDQEVSFTSTRSCTSFGQMMSGRRATSCDFIEKLPDCTEMGLPLYRAFEADELPRLTAILDSAEFADVRDTSRFYRAYWIESRLRPDSDRQTAIFALLDGYYDDPSRAEAAGYIAAVEDVADDLFYGGETGALSLMAAVSTAAMHTYSGEAETAQRWLDAVESRAKAARAMTLDDERATEAVDYYLMWADRLNVCLGDMDGEGCAPDDMVRVAELSDEEAPETVGAEDEVAENVGAEDEAEEPVPAEIIPVTQDAPEIIILDDVDVVDEAATQEILEALDGPLDVNDASDEEVELIELDQVSE